MELGIQKATIRGLASVLAVFALTTTIWFVAEVNEMPDYGPQCNLLGGCTDTSPSCSCPTTEDICVIGAMQKLRWDRICGSLFLCVMSLSAFALMFDRWLTFTIAGKQTKEFKSRIDTAIHESEVEEAIGVAPLYPASPVAAVVSASLSAQPCCSGGIRTLKPSMQARHRAIVFETEDLKRGLWALAGLGWAVPLVGFLIFITGVITALNGMRAAEGTGIAAIAGSLAESLVPMVVSTLIAIPIVWSHRYFASKVDTFSLEMDRLSLAIIDQIMSHQQEFFSRAPRAHYTTQELKSPATNSLTV